MAYLDLTDANEYPLTVGEDLVPPRSDGPKPTLSLDFSSLLNPPLVLKQDLTEGCGGQTWPAGMVLAKYLLRCKIDDFKNKTIIELGAGSGLVGLAFALKLNSSESKPPMYITDIPAMLRLLKHNVSLNPTSHTTEVFALSWGEPLPPMHKTPEIILAADCCYFEPAFPLLLDTLEELLSNKEGATCYFCFKKRRKADMGFVKMARKRFDVKEAGKDDPERGVWQREGIFFFEFRAKCGKT